MGSEWKEEGLFALLVNLTDQCHFMKFLRISDVCANCCKDINTALISILISIKVF